MSHLTLEDIILLRLSQPAELSLGHELPKMQLAFVARW